MRHNFIGKARVLVKGYGTTNNHRRVGVCSSAALNATLDKKTLPDTESPGGGNANTLERISEANLAINFRNFSAENLAIAYLGSAADLAAASAQTITNVTVNQGETVRIDGIKPTGSITVEDAGGAGTTYTAGVDYEVRPAGIYIIEGGGIADATALDLLFDTTAAKVVESLVNTGAEFEVVIDGINEAESEKPFVVDCWRWKPSFSGNEFIGDDFGELPISGELLKDSSRPTGESPFFRLTQVEA